MGYSIVPLGYQNTFDATLDTTLCMESIHVESKLSVDLTLDARPMKRRRHDTLR